MRRCVAAVVVLLSLHVGAAHAQPAKDGQTAEAALVTHAAQEVARGNRLFAERHYREAAQAFEAADALVASAVVQQNAGAAWERAGERACAADAYDAALAAGTLDAEFTADTRRRLGALERELGVLVVAEPSGARIRVAHAAGRAIPTRVHLAPGSYEVVVEMPGRGPVVRTVTVVAAAVTELRVQPDPPRHAPPAAGRSVPARPATEAPWPVTRTLGWIGVGVGVAGAALGGVFAARYLSVRSEFLERPGDALHDEAAGWQTASTATFYPSLAVLAVGVVLLVTGSADARAPNAAGSAAPLVARW